MVVSAMMSAVTCIRCFLIEYKMEYEVDEKPYRFLKSLRPSTEVQLPEPDYPLLPSGAEKPLRPRTRIQGYRLQQKLIPFDKSICKC